MNQKSILTNRVIVALLAILCCLLWGSATPSIKVAYTLFQIGSGDVMSRFLLAGVRFAFAGVLIIAYGSVTGKKLIRPQKENLFLVFKLGMVQTVLQYVLFYTALAYTTGMKSAILGASATFFSIIFSALFHMEKMTSRKVLGCLIGFAGVVIINLSGGSFGPLNLKGDGGMIAQTIVNGYAAILIKRYSVREDPVVLTGYQFLFGGLLLCISGLIGGGKLLAQAPSAWLLMLYMAFLSAVAYTLWTLLLKYNPVSTVTIYNFSNPVFGVLLSALILKESNTFTPIQCVFSLILVCAGILIVNVRINRNRK